MLGNTIDGLNLCRILGVEEEIQIQSDGIQEISIYREEARFDGDLQPLVSHA